MGWRSWAKLRTNASKPASAFIALAVSAACWGCNGLPNAAQRAVPKPRGADQRSPEASNEALAAPETVADGGVSTARTPVVHSPRLDAGEGTVLAPHASATLPETTEGGPRAQDPEPSSEAAASSADQPAASPELVRNFEQPEPLDPELPARTWLLTTEQYIVSVQSLLGVTPDVSRFGSDPDNGVFPNFSNLGLVRDDRMSAYWDAAQQVSDNVSSEQLSALGACSLDTDCRDDFVRALLPRAFRRPVTDDELSSYAEIFDLGVGLGSVELGFRSVVKAVLSSPHFLYRTEIGSTAAESDDQFVLTGHEVASLLSFSVLGEPPSAALLEAAEEGKLTQPDELPRVIQDLLDSNAAAAQFRRFVEQWLEVHEFASLEKDESVYPQFTAAQPAIWQETESFLGKFAAFDSTLEQLLTKSVTDSYRTQDLVSFYTSDTSGAKGGERIGMLSLGTVLATHANRNLTSPTQRGAFIRRRLLCESLMPPPSDIPPLSAAQNSGKPSSTRELYEQHEENPSCASCHQLTDQIGFVFEQFDGAGRYRTLDTTQGAEVAIDTSGKLVNTDVNRELGDPGDLAQALSQSELVRDCLAVQAFRFYFGQAEAGNGLPSIADAHRALSKSDEFAGFIVALLSSETTFKRKR
jgi:hypothetical protein